MAVLLFMNNDIKFMKEAIKEAKKAFDKNEVPIGAILVKNNKIIARAHNLKEYKKDVCAHAEILAIKKASKVLKNWRLSYTTLYVTLEPCAMCASAINQARISRLVFALEDKNNGAVINGPKLYKFKTCNLPPEVKFGILKEESKALLTKFFIKKR